MSDVTFVVQQVVEVTITVRDGSDAITRITGPNGDEWRRDLYPLYMTEDILSMWADNAVRNGIHDASTLDGWGDLEKDEVTISVTSSELEWHLRMEEQ